MAVNKPLALIVALPEPRLITLKVTEPVLGTLPPGGVGILVEVIDKVPPTFTVAAAVVLVNDRLGVLLPIVTTGTPEVRPTRSSRTKVSPSQISNVHGR